MPLSVRTADERASAMAFTATTGYSDEPQEVEIAVSSVSNQSGKVKRMLMTERGDPSVAPPDWEPLASSELFDEKGMPRPDVALEHFKKEGLLSEADALTIIAKCALIWKDEPNVMRLEDPVVISGDVHGQFFDLLNLLSIGGNPRNQKYIFLGDYVDRGCFGMEVILLLMCYKICYPTTMITLRGNHESRHLTAYFNFKREVLYKYSIAVYNAMMSAFDCLPLACIVNNRFLCLHGGLSPELKRVADINAIHRFREPPSSGPMCDLLWADPLDEKEEDSATSPHFVPNTTRGCSYVYSHAAACSFLQENSLITVIRGHEAQDEGYHLYKKTAKGFPAVICIFSAPNYCDTYDNRAAIVMLNKNVMNIRQFNSSPHPYYLPNFMNAFTWSLPFVAEKLLDIWTNVLHLIDVNEDQYLIPGGDANGISSSAANGGSDSGIGNGQGSVLEQRGEHIRKKILTMAKLSRMFRTLREENDNIVLLKGLAGGTIPQGVLQLGPEGVKEAIRGFQRSKELDSPNERWPDSPLEDPSSVPNAVTRALSEHSSMPSP
ncbi:putative serine/threonine protein phosphatase [Leptomonas seymouri]|uniref:Serine/threonine-protein phosphatase n=1 Tax=Leptomonas seymouri TaxID=5684 RepID=A0A0N0P7Y2_LEPSE|nr:putative serine/threonine protein phosphatase [Leptomonas seymouri]|eukprot:KPI88887.1 putative serine/threonine protein phosphatase [Leptomonas seymouri]